LGRERVLPVILQYTSSIITILRPGIEAGQGEKEATEADQGEKEAGTLKQKTNFKGKVA
jgi:hypothetical protein